MLFFQAGLLLGYLYAHALTRLFSIKRQAVFHTVLLSASLFLLPIFPNSRWQPAPGEDPTWRVFAVLAAAVGLPYIMLSATSPLLQSWYSRTQSGALPYRYFALSNAGSLVALIGYPIWIEPYLTGHQQTWGWSAAFALFVLCCVVTALYAARAPVRAETLAREPKSRLSRAQVLLWLALPACASALLLTVTNLLTQNVAPMPLLWVLPLGVYLLTFIFCFESSRWYSRMLFLPLVLPALACLVAVTGPLDNDRITVQVPLLSTALFVCCMACHGELARLKPGAHHLTAFYLFLSAGGVMGGIFVALFAPHFFPSMYENPITFVGCAALLLCVLWRERAAWRSPNLGFALWMFALSASFLFAVYVAKRTWMEARSSRLMVRNFYGALRVNDEKSGIHMARDLMHGTITHGIQFLDPVLRHFPTTYYAHNSGIGLTWRVLARSGPLRMGVVGLGAGTLAAYGRGGDVLRFYDINPLVIDIAKNQFTYVYDCAAHVDIVLGDARLSLAREPNQQFDILVIDAFSGDSIPVHLLTREAFAIYWRHLKPNGVLAVHVSNRYLNLSPVVMLAAKESGKRVFEVDNDDDDNREIYGANYVLVTSRPNFFDQPEFRGRLLAINVPTNLRTWTDDYSNLWQVLTYK